jgi:hypothetical protein
MKPDLSVVCTGTVQDQKSHCNEYQNISQKEQVEGSFPAGIFHGI